MALEGSKHPPGGKAKKRKSKKSLKKNVPAITSDATLATASKRDFQGDLKIYLDSWRGRDAGSGWKFNKVLQSWATQYAMNKKMIDKDLFKLLCPYLATMMGVQRERFVESIEAVIDGGDQAAASDDEGGDANGGAIKPCYKRAMKLRTVMEESDQ